MATMRVDTAVVLVAGVGARLRPLTEEIPKALVPVQGQPLLLRTMNVLREHGVERVVLATGYRADAVQRAVSQSHMDVRLCHNERYDSTQNAISLARCAPELRGRNFFKLDGDLLFSPAVLTRLLSSSAPLAVAVDPTRNVDEEAMKVRVDDNARVTQFGKGIPCHEAYGESIGVERVASEATDALFTELESLERDGVHDLYYEDVYSRLISAGRLDAAAVSVGDLPWAEIDTFEDLSEAESQAARITPVGT